jgi:transposase
MYSNATVKEAVRRYNAGEATPAIAAFLGTHQTGAYQLLKANGVQMRSRGRPGFNGPARRRKGSLEEIVVMVKSGMTLEAIAKECNTARQNISHLLIRNGYRPSEMERAPRPAPPPTARQLEIVELYKQGIPPKEISERFGISKGVIQLAREKCGVTAHPPAFFHQDETYLRRNKEVAERYLRGDKTADIAADLGIFPTAIPRILRRQGLAPTRMPTAGRWAYTRTPAAEKARSSATPKLAMVNDPKYVSRVIALHNKGVKQGKILDQTGLKRGTVQRIIERHA